MMFKVRAIKMMPIVEIIFAFVFFGIAGVIFSLAYSAQGTSDYYWSREFRSAVSLFYGFASCATLMGAISLGLGISAWLLEKTGKVCPQCESVYSSMAVKCPKCGTDMIYAKKVNEYLAENPTVAKSAPTAGNADSSGKDSRVNASDRRFCTQCGHEIRNRDAFCSHCGSKQ